MKYTLKYLIFLFSFIFFANLLFSKISNKDDILNHEDSIVNNFINKGIYCLGKNFDSSLYYLSQATKYSNRIKNTNLKGLAYFKYGTCLLYISKYDDAINNFKIAESYFLKTNNNIKLSKVHNNLATTYENMLDYKNSLSNYFKSLNDAELANDTSQILNVEQNIINFYINLKEYSKARQMCNNIYKNDYHTMDNYNKSKFLVCCARLNKNDSLDLAISQLKKALSFYNFDSIDLINERSQFIGGLFFALGDFYGAKFSIKKSEANFRKAQKQIFESIAFNKKYKFNFNLNGLYSVLGQLYYDNQNYDSCIHYLRLADSYKQVHSYNQNTNQFYRLLSNSFEKIGKYDSAYHYSKIINNMNDSIKTDEIKKKMLSLELDYELKKKDAENNYKLLEKDKFIAKRNVIILLISIVSLLLVFLILFYNQIKQKQKQKEFALLLIKTQEDERLRLSRELHDSIGQGLLFLKMESGDKYAKLIDPLMEELRAISRNLHPVKIETLSLQTLLINLVETAKSSSLLFFTYDIEETLVNELNSKINIYRIVQECISNIIKHSHAKNARITLTTEKSHTVITIMDDGCGFNLNDITLKQSIGLISMQERAKLIGAEFKLKSSSSGTRVELQFKNE